MKVKPENKEKEEVKAGEEVMIEDLQTGQRVYISSTKYDVAQLLGLARQSFKKCFPGRTKGRKYIG